MILFVIGASWAGEGDIAKGKIEPLRLQRARFNGLAGPGFIEGNSDHVHPVRISCTVVNRDCKPTQQLETLACLWGAESGARTCAAIADARGARGAGKKLPTNWEDKPAMPMRYIWMTHCKSLGNFS
eukprot:6899523-Pyramimonas_sp.AAC.2